MAFTQTSSLEACATVGFEAISEPNPDLEPAKRCFQSVWPSLAAALALCGRDHEGCELFVASVGADEARDLLLALREDSQYLRNVADLLAVAEWRLLCGAARHLTGEGAAREDAAR